MMPRKTLAAPLLALAAAATLAGCAPGYRGMDSAHQPVVSRTDYAFDVAVGPGGLQPGEQRRLSGWLDTLQLRYGDQVAIDDPQHAHPAARADVAGLVARYGLLLAGDAAVTSAPVATGTVRVVVSRAQAAVPGCPDYSHMNDPNFDAHTSSNYGCAVNSNLAAMVANPMDLVRGATGGSTSDGIAGARAVTAMRAARPTGFGGEFLKNKAEGPGK